jgi:cystathionine beta-lyase/cystathionine gamma-synthase
MAATDRPTDALGKSTPLVPPLYQSAVYTLPDLDALDAIYNDGAPGFIYARDGHPNARSLGEQVAALHKAQWGVVCGSGMAAISAILVSLLQQGDRVVASNRLYGRTTELFGKELSRYGVKTTFVDANDLGAVKEALTQPAKLLFVETMSNPALRVVDLPGLAELTKQGGCLLAVDNTFATPVLCRPLEQGADLVMESLTKMMGGHSDVTLGALGGFGAETFQQMNQAVSTWGFQANPFDCWLAIRGLPTLALRMRAASANAERLAAWLVKQPGVSRVLYPGLPEHPDHDLARRVLDGAFGNMLCFELAGGREAVNRFMRTATGIPFSPSLGHPTTTLSHPGTTSHRHASPAEKKRQGITDGLVRLSVGVEDLKQIQGEFSRGLK